jgi:membrane protein required for beta-lactamase induction
MPDWLLDRTTVIALAIIGGACSILASWCQSREHLSTPYAGWLTRASYVFMGVSIVLFIGAGMFGTEQ